MKKIALFFVLFSFLNVSYSQKVYKMRATSYCHKIKNDYGNWSEWSPTQESNVLIVTTTASGSGRITIYGEKVQNYDIIKWLEKETDSDGDTIFQWFCVDDNGMRVIIRHVFLNSQGGREQISVDFKNLILLYNVRLVD